ncbi:hypothetical protein [Methylocucumis oryzae]|uniref:Uncharacterized protein n=1 Tax=Methylocucumis oryzae TaxID=1632867 RepID=A0A0F3II15_9GAMM|nr:hypothetical protein [Methylocucumis oryzae]KJV06391.1 hypothetical protein VZ94_11530 [Methylocucumis oryzae]
MNKNHDVVVRNQEKGLCYLALNLLIVLISTLLSIASLIKLPTAYLIALHLYSLNQCLYG